MPSVVYLCSLNSHLDCLFPRDTSEQCRNIKRGNEGWELPKSYLPLLRKEAGEDRRETAAKTLFKQMRDVNHPLHSLVPDDRQQSTRRSLRNGNHISTPKYSDSNTSLNGL
ncbi:hypothetical protein Bbelb_350650 [Branchiostoma belcheri]|nr:hypothetical protein Bbelb_350650 [Branchiostoma belcheri]